MRPQFAARAYGAGMVLGALITISLTALSPATALADGELTATVKQRHVRYGQALVVTGQLASGEAGKELALELRSRRDAAWRVLGHVTTGSGGYYRIAARLPLSGAVRVVVADSGNGEAHAADAAPAPQQSPEQGVTLVAALRAHSSHLNVVAGRSTVVRGVAGGSGRGRRVTLQQHAGGRWRTVARASTGRHGAFRLRYTPRRPGSAVLRVRVRGDRELGGSRRGVGRLNVYRRVFVSWYGPGFFGQRTACGGTLNADTLGVAHKTLPCGTKVTLRYRGHSVRVPVVDRGPYVGGREYDLTAATKRALHFGSTGTILATK